METGAVIRQARKERQWTQATLAKKVGVARETVAVWETANRRPIPVFRRRIQRILGVELANKAAQDTDN